MDSFSLYRDRIGESLARRLAEAIGNEVVTLDEGAEIGKNILAGVNGAGSPEELIEFVHQLSQKWTLFGPVLVMEQSLLSQQKNEIEMQEKEKQATDQISDLLKENKIDEAIATAENATHVDDQNSTPAPQSDTTSTQESPSNNNNQQGEEAQPNV